MHAPLFIALAFVVTVTLAYPDGSPCAQKPNHGGRTDRDCAQWKKYVTAKRDGADRIKVTIKGSDKDNDYKGLAVSGADASGQRSGVFDGELPDNLKWACDGKVGIVRYFACTTHRK